MMDNQKQVTVQILNAFTENDKGGNPAGVVLNADALSHENKLTIAQKVGLSETAFISQSKTADYKLDFYTPTKQIAHCGHATVAAFSYLKQLGLLKSNSSSKETIDGNRKIEIQDDLAFMEQTAPSYIDVSEKKNAILNSLGLSKKDLLPNAPMQVVNTGNSFLLIPVKDAKTLEDISPDFDDIESISEAYDLIGYYIFTTDTTAEIDATARMFAPRYGILEEAGTGMAAGPLASYLFHVLQLKKTTFKIQQGKYMSPPSSSVIEVQLQVKNEHITGLMAGGKGVVAAQVEIDFTE
ncbi:PhzF family phenazine biosynthesis isomerase [Maribacter sp. SA7]|uniref:PhzF family phenazine biosynthesis protein n=1 Tax=Maribacter zhoushanensis TaxID=3030012 RepID=UPI0023EB8C7E|nr:PhzF family phenazine biosynthesis isomerase [Maribacter zhoushanensis]MDF4203390.1 PhzF family phenazine biosynthesis isomerase [Maribacter zhoushanensis]